MNMKLPNSALAVILGAAFAAGSPALHADQAPAAAPVRPEAGTPGPHIRFEMPVYDFGKVTGGAVVKYEFVFTNTGDALLVVSNVQPGCGCTTAGNWSKEVEAGKTGTIPIQFNSGAYTGPVTKTVTVTSNDKSQPSIGLQLKGTIWRAIDVLPQNAILNFTESSSTVTSVVRIVNNMEQPITLSEPECNNHSFAATLETTQPGKEFRLMVRNVMPVSNNVSGVFSMKTSSTNMPVLSVTAFGMVQPAVAVVPPQIMLPGNVGNVTSALVSIRNNGTNLLSLSNATVNAEGVDVQVKETEPGRQFTITLAFPKGFQMPNGEAALTINSSHPQFKTITVPIRQPQAPHNQTSSSTGSSNPPAAALAARAAVPGLLNPTNRPATKQ